MELATGYGSEAVAIRQAEDLIQGCVADRDHRVLLLVIVLAGLDDHAFPLQHLAGFEVVGVGSTDRHQGQPVSGGHHAELHECVAEVVPQLRGDGVQVRRWLREFDVGRGDVRGGGLALVREAGRGTAFLFSADGIWERPIDSDRVIAWLGAFVSETQAQSSGGMYVNFPKFTEEGDELIRASYGSNYERLVALKNKYDPGNLFRMNLNIKPTV